MIQYIHSKKKKNQNNLQYSLLFKTEKRKGGNFVTYDHYLIIHHSIISDHLRIRKKWSDDNLMKQHVVSPFVPVYFQVKEIEKRDSVLTSPQQIERLTRPGSTYFNLNPYEVSAHSLITPYFKHKGYEVNKQLPVLEKSKEWILVDIQGLKRLNFVSLLFAAKTQRSIFNSKC